MTYTIIGSWAAAGSQPGAEDALAERGKLSLLAAFCGNFLSGWAETDKALAADVGFTIHSTLGGGAGWDTEPGFTIVLANLGPEHRVLVHGLASAVKAHERQQAVVVLERAETFTLVGGEFLGQLGDKIDGALLGSPAADRCHYCGADFEV